jgi:hypothetical protein
MDPVALSLCLIGFAATIWSVAQAFATLSEMLCISILNQFRFL